VAHKHVAKALTWLSCVCYGNEDIKLQQKRNIKNRISHKLLTYINNEHVY